MKNKYITISAIVFFIAVLGWIYYNTNISKSNTKAGAAGAQGSASENELSTTSENELSTASDVNDIDGENTDEKDNTDDQDDNSSEDDKTHINITSQPASVVVERNMVIFQDKNNNGFKDSGENPCSQCADEKVIAIKQDPAFGLPNLDKLNVLSLGAGGVIAESKLTGYNSVWGVIEGKSLLVPISQINLGDGTNDAQIPAITYTVKLAGVNANIIESEIIDQDTIYYFSKLIPTMQTSSEKGNPIYAKFISASDLSKYYIGKGSITHKGEKCLLKINWGLPSSFNNEIQNTADLTFYII